MAILSAYSRRSPTSTAESSPTLEQQFDSIEMQYSDKINADEGAEHLETKAEENPAEAKSRTCLYSTCVTEVNLEILKTPTEEENNLNGFSKQIDAKTEMPELNTEFISKAENTSQRVTAHLEIFMSKENKEEGNELIEKSLEAEQHTILKSQALRRVFRGDSRDSGISDCSSNQATSSLQVDELGVVSTIEEEADHELREGKRVSKVEGNRRSLTAGIVTGLTRDRETPLYRTGSITDDDKVATKSDVTKASCETNPVPKGVCKCDESVTSIIKHSSQIIKRYY